MSPPSTIDALTRLFTSEAEIAAPLHRDVSDVVGVPRLLSSNDAQRLLQLVGLVDPVYASVFQLSPMVTRWAKVRGLTLDIKLDPTTVIPSLACQFYASRRRRDQLLMHCMRSIRARRKPLVSVPLCLEWEILAKHFKLQAAELLLAGARGESLDDQMHKTMLQIQDVVYARIKRWGELEPEHCEATILGIFYLVTMTNSILPSRWAGSVVPELKEEFSDLKLVKAKHRSQMRIPRVAHLERVQRRCMAQIELTRYYAASLLFERPGEEAIEQLGREVKVLANIIRARSKLTRASNAPAQV